MLFTLERRYADNTVQHRTQAEAPDVAHALYWAVRNWSPAQGLRRDAHSFYLDQSLFVDGVPIADVLAAINAPVREAA